MGVQAAILEVNPNILRLETQVVPHPHWAFTSTDAADYLTRNIDAALGGRSVTFLSAGTNSSTSVVYLHFNNLAGTPRVPQSLERFLRVNQNDVNLAIQILSAQPLTTRVLPLTRPFPLGLMLSTHFIGEPVAGLQQVHVSNVSNQGNQLARRDGSWVSVLSGTLPWGAVDPVAINDSTLRFAVASENLLGPTQAEISASLQQLLNLSNTRSV